jgi:hypothetical protein
MPKPTWLPRRRISSAKQDATPGMTRLRTGEPSNQTIAEMKTVFHVTYEIVTSESAEQGEAAERGYVHANGGRDAFDRVEDVNDYAMDLRTAVRLSNPCWNNGSWFDSESQIEDYATDEHVSYSLHPPRNITPSSYARLARLLEVRK